MRFQIKRYIAKGMRKILQPPAITNSTIHKTSSICSGSQINDTIIDKYTYIGHNCFTVNVDIGSFCSIADGCRIGGAEHQIKGVSTSPVFYSGKNIMKKNFCNIEDNVTKKTVIGSDVWIGANVCIKSGVTIGNGAIIGMGAVVTHDVNPYEIVVGVPAKIVKKRFDEKTIEILNRSKWWEWDDKIIEKYSNYFENLEQFVKLLEKMEEK